MAINSLPEAPVVRLIVPSLTKDKRVIPAPVRERFIKAIEARTLDINKGFTKIEGRGGYRALDGSISYEDVLIVESHGSIPFTEKELSFFAKELTKSVCSYSIRNL